MNEEKQAIRERALKFREELEPHPDLADQAAKNFLDAVKVSSGQKVALYFPLGHELDTMPVVEELWRKGNMCLLPVFGKDDLHMKFAKWEKDTKLSPQTFDIPMPEIPEFHDPDIVVVPIVAFDQKGNRIGFGKGYYDATLKMLREKKDILAVGYAYAEQAVLMKLPTEPHDEKLDIVITPQRVFDFRT